MSDKSRSFDSVIRSIVVPSYFTELSLLIVNFSVGILLGPTSFGVSYFLAYTLLYLCAIIYVDRGKTSLSRPGYLLGLLCSGLLGFIIGRLVAGQFLRDPFSIGSILSNK